MEIRKENINVEFKKAKGGLPKSVWETYSAFCNSDGGTIYLGIEENEKGRPVSAKLTEKETDNLMKEFWATVNNPGKVSINILKEEDVYTDEYDNYPILIINVPKALREFRPVYIDNNINTGTYKRNNEGDYHCTAAEIRAMLRDASDKPQDLLCLQELGLDTLCEETVQSYRNRFSVLHPDHAFLNKSNEEFLEFIGAIRKDLNGVFHPTRAGLLMFGYAYKIVYEFPEYFLDYEEHHSEDENIRWSDRLNSDSGQWSGNLFDFYTKVTARLSSDIKSSFRINDTIRNDDNELHILYREALCNAMSNADFYLSQGLVVQSYENRIEFSNPGSLRISLKDAYKEGVSDARNKTILKMFNLIGVGERAGSGIPTIINICKKYNLPSPEYELLNSPDRVRLTLYLSSSKESDKGDKRTRIMKYMEQHKECKAKDIAEALNLSVSTVKKELYGMLEEELIEANGIIKDRKYSLK
ncbi:MAG: ATP-binding protein [Erysipelotrichaceae bacterium]|nr:ATP-binding protein [Erysipelotrichaceae bacterium]